MKKTSLLALLVLCSIGVISMGSHAHAAGTTIGITILPADLDNDGIADEIDPDMDGDGVLNVYDTDVDGDGIANGADADDDGDGIADGSDTVQPNDADGYGTLTDVDGDGILNALDADIDGDGVLNNVDPDTDGDGIINAADTDDDNDGILDGSDSSPRGALPGDIDADGVADAIDPDVDGDGVLNIYDTDIDGDGIVNGSDPDDDGDGILDGADIAHPNDANGYGTVSDVDGDGQNNGIDYDIDGDGQLNNVDSDTDGDGIPNSIDTDDDNDSITDLSDSTPVGAVAGGIGTGNVLPWAGWKFWGWGTFGGVDLGTWSVWSVIGTWSRQTWTNISQDSAIRDPELVLAFEWAKRKKITSMNTITWALLLQSATRFSVAKFMTQYITEVLGESIPSRAVCDVSLYDDFNVMDVEQAYYAQAACQLGIMGIRNKDKTMISHFRPSDLITRAEFAAVLSRYLYGSRYEWESGENWFVKHLQALHEAGYIKQIDHPTMHELRGYILLILYRIDQASK